VCSSDLDEREDALAIFGVGVSDRVFDKGSLTVAPNPFSPNGDGRFDEVEFSYELAKIGTPQRVRLRIFDLRGRELQELTFRQKSGSHTVKWDGRGEDGQLVPPGLYLFQVNVDSGRPVRFSGSVVVSY
jgi:gliding motility-associated-like protein